MHLLKQHGTIKGISKATGLNRTTIYQALTCYQIATEQYDKSSFMRQHMASLTESEKARRVQAAHDAVRGTPRPRVQRLKSALTLQENAWNHLSTGERVVVELCQERGISFVPHKAIDVFNIDIALTECDIAIEIQGGHWHTSPQKATQDAKKASFLENQGWQIVEFWGSPSEIRTSAIAWFEHHKPLWHSQ